MVINIEFYILDKLLKVEAETEEIHNETTIRVKEFHLFLPNGNELKRSEIPIWLKDIITESYDFKDYQNDQP